MKIFKISPKILSKKVFSKNISKKFIFFEKIKLIIRIFILITFIITLTQIQEKNENSENWELVFILDTSLSMLAVDERDFNAQKISRLSLAKNIIENIIDKNEGNKFWLIIFSDKSYISLPLTSDTDSFKTILSWINPSQMQSKWSTLKDTINNIIKIYDSSESKTKKSILISDWEFHENIPSLENLKKDNIEIASIWVWSTNWSKIPIKTKPWWWVIEYKKYEWQFVISKLNESNLLKISRQSWPYFKSNQIEKINNYFWNNIKLENEWNFDKIEFLLIVIFLLLCVEILINRIGRS